MLIGREKEDENELSKFLNTLIANQLDMFIRSFKHYFLQHASWLRSTLTGLEKKSSKKTNEADSAQRSVDAATREKMKAGG